MQEIKFRILDNNDNEVWFKTKLNARMNNVYNAYKERQGIIGNISLIYDNNEITIYDTPGLLEMSDNDTIYISKDSNDAASNTIIDIKISNYEKFGTIRVYPNTIIKKLVEQFKKKYDVDINNLEFKKNLCNENDTISSLNVQTGDIFYLK